MDKKKYFKYKVIKLCNIDQSYINVCEIKRDVKFWNLVYMMTLIF